MNKRRLLKLADYLAGPVAKADAAARKKGRYKFYMEDWYCWNNDAAAAKADYNHPSKIGLTKSLCGTAACALGWASAIFRGLQLKDGCVYLRREKEWGSEAGRIFFDLTTGQSERLFYGPGCTPKKKADEIRKMVRAE